MGEHTPGFSITDHKGFQIRFENGWTVSVQFGPGNYCEHYPGSSNYDAPRKAERRWESSNAEVAAWDENDNWYDFGRDKVAGYYTPEQVVSFIKKIAAKKAGGK